MTIKFKEKDRVKVVKVIRSSDGAVNPIEFQYYINKFGTVIHTHPIIRYGKDIFYSYNVKLDNINQIFAFIGEELEEA